MDYKVIFEFSPTNLKSLYLLLTNSQPKLKHKLIFLYHFLNLLYKHTTEKFYFQSKSQNFFSHLQGNTHLNIFHNQNKLFQMSILLILPTTDLYQVYLKDFLKSFVKIFFLSFDPSTNPKTYSILCYNLLKQILLILQFQKITRYKSKPN